MASKEEVFSLTAQREVLRSFSLSDTEMSVEQNPQHTHTHTHHDSLMCQWVVAEDALEMAQLLDAKHERVEQIGGRAGPQGASGCSLTNAAPGYGEGGSQEKELR